jgi:predicted RNase H-like HicB family nuclease
MAEPLRGRATLQQAMGQESSARTYNVRADWDAEAEVWVAFSDEVPGLATEAATLEALTEKLRTLIPELLEANHPEIGDLGREISFEIVGHRRERLLMAS